ncbi:MAG: hypothetical protein CFE32_05895 [Alphaproteobacteria bacterium PA3]|nr:MAG: hypothetical protein CFE32_05895 [Alphaproteobacteria bacterium PA3]
MLSFGKATKGDTRGQQCLFANLEMGSMKVSIEVDLTPSEARELLGMPNLTSIQETFVGIAKDKLEKTGNMVDVEPMLRTWTGLGGAATEAFGALVGAALKVATSDLPSKPAPTSDKSAGDKTS